MKEFAMKRSAALLTSAVILGVLYGCALLLGPDEPVGQDDGNLSISFGDVESRGNQRAITSGAELPDAVRASLHYELSLAGPGGETLEQTVSGGENLRLTVSLGEWRIQAKAYQGNVLAGTGELTHPVMPGINAVQIPMTVNQGYFAISIQTDNGTVEADVAAAFPETPVTLTVTPDSGYMLKSGTLKYSYGGADYPITGTTFFMPASDVTISAFFNKSIGFAIQGPQEEMVEVTVEHSTGSIPATHISWSGDETLTFTVEGYSAEDGNLKWVVNGNEVSGAGNSLVVRAKDYIQRTYDLTALIKVNNQWYSGGYSFTVGE
jgi:hypothetical protein